MTLPIKTMGNFVIAEEIPVEVKAGKLLLTSAKKSDQFLRVVSGGSDKGLYPGDQILVNNEWNKKFMYEDKEYCIVLSENIVGVVKNETSRCC